MNDLFTKWNARDKKELFSGSGILPYTNFHILTYTVMSLTAVVLTIPLLTLWEKVKLSRQKCMYVRMAEDDRTKCSYLFHS